MAKRITPKLIKASDDLGLVKAQIAELNEEKADLEAIIINSGVGEIEGDLFRSVHVHAERKQVAWKKIAIKAGASKQQNAGNTTTISVDSVKVSARTTS